jgi:hypothetical protein
MGPESRFPVGSSPGSKNSLAHVDGLDGTANLGPDGAQYATIRGGRFLDSLRRGRVLLGPSIGQFVSPWLVHFLVEAPPGL